MLPVTDLAVSVIVVSRDRPDALLRCLAGLEQLYHARYEIIVVADPAGLQRLENAGFAGRIKARKFDRPNISEARNIGLAEAAGDVVAFIDDDSVPEPSWLDHLADPFRQADIAAAGGYVLGRNGITFQNRGRRVDALGRHEALDLADNMPRVFGTSPGRAIKTEGTNCAFRTEILRRIGGFDPNYRFFLDETDVNLRLAEEGLATAIVPLAQVHHGFAASDRRTASRMPTSLFDVGASQAVFLRRHAPEKLAEGLARMADEQRRRLLRYMVAGQCEPRDVGRILKSFAAGVEDGRGRPLSTPAPLDPTGAGFLRFLPRRSYDGMDYLFGRPAGAAALKHAATDRLRRGRRVSLFLLSRTTLFHRAYFADAGYWVQHGGQFGQSLRKGPWFRRYSLQGRADHERARVAPVRGRSIPRQVGFEL